MTFSTLYNLNESEETDLKKLDWATELYRKILGNIQRGIYIKSPNITKRKNDLFYNLYFDELTLKLTNGDSGVNLDDGLKLTVHMFDDKESVEGMKNSTEEDLRRSLYDYFVEHKNTIIHELVHVYQMQSHPVIKTGHIEDDSVYANKPQEVDAYTMEFIALLKDKIEMDPEFKDRFKKDIASDIWLYTLAKLIPTTNSKDSLRGFLKYMNNDTKTKVLKRIYTHIQ